MQTPPPARGRTKRQGAHFSARDNSENKGIHHKQLGRDTRAEKGFLEGENKAVFSSELYIEERGLLNFFRKRAKTGVFSRKKRKNGENGKNLNYRF